MLLKNIFKDLCRRKTKTILTIAVSILFSVFLIIYQSVIVKNNTQLDTFAKELAVTGTITDYTGSNTIGLRIDYNFIDSLAGNDLISDVSYTSFAKGTLSSFTEPSLNVLPSEAMGKNILTSNLFSTLESRAENITFLDGYDKDTLYNEPNTCVVDIYLYQSLTGGKPNNTDPIIYKCSIYDVRPNEFGVLEFKYINTIEFKVIGSFFSSDTDLESTTSVFCSTDTMKSIFEQQNRMFYLDSTKFTITDPLKMNKFNATMKTLGFIPADLQSQSLSSTSNALVVNDEVFLNAALPIIKNTNTLKLFYVVIFLLIVLMGGIISFLGVQSKKDEIAVSRSLGATKKSISIYVLCENVITCIVGIIIGALISLFIPTIQIDITTILILLLYLVLYQVGSSVAVVQSNRIKITDLLTKSE